MAAKQLYAIYTSSCYVQSDVHQVTAPYSISACTYAHKNTLCKLEFTRSGHSSLPGLVTSVEDQEFICLLSPSTFEDSQLLWHATDAFSSDLLAVLCVSMSLRPP